MSGRYLHSSQNGLCLYGWLIICNLNLVAQGGLVSCSGYLIHLRITEVSWIGKASPFMTLPTYFDDFSTTYLNLSLCRAFTKYFVTWSVSSDIVSRLPDRVSYGCTGVQSWQKKILGHRSTDKWTRQSGGLSGSIRSTAARSPIPPAISIGPIGPFCTNSEDNSYGCF